MCPVITLQDKANGIIQMLQTSPERGTYPVKLLECFLVLLSAGVIGIFCKRENQEELLRLLRPAAADAEFPLSTCQTMADFSMLEETLAEKTERRKLVRLIPIDLRN